MSVLANRCPLACTFKISKNRKAGQRPARARRSRSSLAQGCLIVGRVAGRHIAKIIGCGFGPLILTAVKCRRRVPALPSGLLAVDAGFSRICLKRLPRYPMRRHYAFILTRSPFVAPACHWQSTQESCEQYADQRRRLQPRLDGGSACRESRRGAVRFRASRVRTSWF